MSAVDKHEFGQAFPMIQEDDPFGAFPSTNSNMDSEDPFASANGPSDPFSMFDASAVTTALKNPFLDDNFGEFPEPSNRASGTATPVDDLQSLQSDETPWPGNNTSESTVESSRDSAAQDSSSDVANTHEHACLSMDTSESSASSGRPVPDIALDSDSGNLTADVNENACVPNTIYALMNSADGERPIEPAATQPQVPEIVFTEASVVLEKSSHLEAPEGSSSTGDGHSRLLDSSELETSSRLDQSQSNISSVSSQECNTAQSDNLSTMNISLIDTTSEGNVSSADVHNSEPSQAHDFFVQSESYHEEIADESEVKSDPNTEVPSTEADAEPLSKTDRVFTSSPISQRTMIAETEGANNVLLAWEQSHRVKISSKDEKEKKDIEELREQAKNDLERWYRDRKTKIEAQHALNLEHQEVQYAERADAKEKEKTIWQRMANLALELQHVHKVDEKRKDTSKMKHLLQLLAVKAPSLKQ